ncbi:MAG: hypothetical protein WB630_23330 [Candidatus Acidiferrales bacterium]
MPEVRIRFEGYLIRETAGWLLGMPPLHITMEDHKCCYIDCPEPGTIHIGANGGNSHWICSRHLDKWNADRARFLSDGGGCEMEELGKLPREKSTSRKAGTVILTLAFIQRIKKVIMRERGA